MNWMTRMATVLGAATLVSLGSVSAEAQTIRTYGESDAGSTNVIIPGAPVPQPQAQAPQQQPETVDAAGDEAAAAGTYQISMYGVRAEEQDAAQRSEVFRRDPHELYRGIIPGVRDELPHLAALKQDANKMGVPTPLTWVGFQAEEARTRVFFQSPRRLQYRVRRVEGSDDLIIAFEHTRIPVRNFSRFIDTSYFGRALLRIEASEVPGGNVEIRLTLRENLEPTISAVGDYLYLDFAHQGSKAGDAEQATNR